MQFLQQQNKITQQQGLGLQQEIASSTDLQRLKKANLDYQRTYFKVVKRKISEQLNDQLIIKQKHQQIKTLKYHSIQQKQHLESHSLLKNQNMILTYDEIYNKFQKQLITKERFKDLLHIAYINIHENINGNTEQQITDFDEEDLKLKIEVMRLIKENNPLNYIQPDELYIFDSGLQNAVDDLEKSYHEYDIYKCKKCSKIMTQALELECGCCICTKCLLKHNNRQHSKRQSVNQTPMTINSQYQEHDSQNVQKKVQCPVCNEQIFYIKQLRQVNDFTRQLKYCCKYKGCTRVDTYEDLLQHMQTCRFGYEELHKGLGGYYQRILQHKDQEIARLKRQIDEYANQLHLQMTELRISKMFNTEIRRELQESKVQSITYKFSESPTTDVTLSTGETKNETADKLLLKSVENVENHDESNTFQSHISRLKETLHGSSIVTSIMDKPDNAGTPSSGHNKLTDLCVTPLKRETSEKNLQNSIKYDFTLCKMQYQEYIPQQDIMERSNMRMSFLNNSSLVLSSRNPAKPNPTPNLYIQLKCENNKLKEELTRVKNQLVSSMNQSMTQSSKKQIKVIQYPQNFIGSLDYDLTVITLLRYIFYADEYEGARLQILCQQQRKMLVEGLNYKNDNIQLKYENLVKFVAGIFYYYSKGVESNEQFIIIQDLLQETLKNKQLDGELPSMKQIYQMMCQRKENSREFNKVELGGFIMRNEFGIEARLSMLEYIQNLKQQLKKAQEELIKQ